jgi:hypothetical protein
MSTKNDLPRNHRIGKSSSLVSSMRRESLPSSVERARAPDALVVAERLHDAFLQRWISASWASSTAAFDPRTTFCRLILQMPGY